jgi:hypothetical protein
MTPPPDDEATGLPGLRTWRRVYVLVVVILALWVGFLTALTRMYP